MMNLSVRSRPFSSASTSAPSSRRAIVAIGPPPCLVIGERRSQCQAHLIGGMSSSSMGGPAFPRPPCCSGRHVPLHVPRGAAGAASFSAPSPGEEGYDGAELSAVAPSPLGEMVGLSLGEGSEGGDVAPSERDRDKV